MKMKDFRLTLPQQHADQLEAIVEQWCEWYADTQQQEPAVVDKVRKQFYRWRRDARERAA